jgi:acid phosphatase
MMVSLFCIDQMDNDGHDTGVVHAAQWFSKFLEPRLKEPTFTKNTLFVSTFDEAKHYTHVPNRVQTVLFGPDLKRPSNATTDDKTYNHYSILRTIEDNVSERKQKRKRRKRLIVYMT